MHEVNIERRIRKKASSEREERRGMEYQIPRASCFFDNMCYLAFIDMNKKRFSHDKI